MNCVIIVAAGSGKRIGGNIPKQFININGHSILYYTLNRFIASGYYDEYIIVFSKDYLTEGYDLMQAFPHANIKICAGGKERFDSVKNALQLVSEFCNTISIHDAVRPFVTSALLARSLTTVKKYGCAIPGIAIKDSIRILDSEGNSQTVDRSQLRSIQTPQVFETNKLIIAYEQDYRAEFTDDATVFEQAGYSIHLFEGDVNNIKITTPEDLEIVAVRLKNLSA